MCADADDGSTDPASVPVHYCCRGVPVNIMIMPVMATLVLSLHYCCFGVPVNLKESDHCGGRWSLNGFKSQNKLLKVGLSKSTCTQFVLAWF